MSPESTLTLNNVQKNGTLAIRLARENARILSICWNGEELAVPAGRSFLFRLRNRKGDFVDMGPEEFSGCQYEDGCFRFSGCGKFPGLSFELRIRLRGQYFAFSNAVSGVPSDHVLEWVDAPQVHVREDRILFQPMHDGALITNPESRESNPFWRYHPIEGTKRGQGYGCNFPGRCMMQYLADYTEKAGLFFAAFDEQCIPKAVEYAPLHDGTMRLSLQTFTGCGFGCGYQTPFEYVIGGFQGDWRNAAQLYRDWYDSYAPAPRPFPSWFEKSPVFLIYPVLGTGLDHGKHQLHENEYYPYSKALPCVRKYNRLFDSPILSLLMHWEGTAPWAPPYVWPPRGGEELLADYRDALHAEGNLLGLYCSGTGWTQTSSITDYTQEKRCAEEHLEHFMARGPKGEIDAVTCNGPDSQRMGYEMCMAEEWCRKQVVGEIRKMAEFGVDYCQYFDQNLGGGQPACYSQEHHHAPVPGPLQTETMKTLMREMTDDIARANSQMVMGCECSAAEPFVNHLQLNDARPNFVWWHGKPVPAQSYVFHGRTLCFAGNQGGVSWMLNLEDCPENLLFREAYAFTAGDFLAVTLKDGGEIHWGWALSWEHQAPEQSDVITLIRNLNGIRRKYPDFLLHGRMTLPLATVICENWTLRLLDREEQFPAVLDSSWENAEGEKIQILVNYLPREQRAMVDGKDVVVPALDAVVLQQGQACRH